MIRKTLTFEVEPDIVTISVPGPQPGECEVIVVQLVYDDQRGRGDDHGRLVVDILRGDGHVHRAGLGHGAVVVSDHHEAVGGAGFCVKVEASGEQSL